MNDSELIKKYNDDVRVKFLGMGICPDASQTNTKVIDCFYNDNFKEMLLNKENRQNTSVDVEPTRQLHESIMNETLKIKDENIKVLLLRIHSPYDNAQELYDNMDTSKAFIIDNLNHSMKVFLFDNIDSDFYQLI